MRYGIHFKNAHQPVFREGYCGVNTDKFPFEGDMSDYILTNKLRINHYWSRDEDFFYNRKIPRHKKWGGMIDPQRVLPKMNLQRDEVILRYVSRLELAKKASVC